MSQAPCLQRAYGVKPRLIKHVSGAALADTLEVQAVGRPLTPLTIEGLQLGELCAGDHLAVHTATAVYELTVVSPRHREVVIRGGIFPAITSARVERCSRDGMFLRPGTLAVGCAMELTTSTAVFVTEPVTAIGFVRRM
jgi:hypothetical protein